MPKITALQSETTPTGDDLLAIVDNASGTTKKITRNDLLKAPLPANSVTTAAIADGSIEPSKRSGGFAIGIISVSTLSTTGIKNITGLGFKPKLVRFTIAPVLATGAAITGSGAMTETSQQATATYAGSAGFRRTSSTGVCFVLSDNSSSPLVASYSSMNADGFSVNVSAATTLADVHYEAYA